jgi:hypothetical protein
LTVPTIGEIWIYDGRKLYMILDKDNFGRYDLLRIGDDSGMIDLGYDMMHWIQIGVWKKL